ncbi:MAG: tRNA pseudouridine(13) synthase TruD [Ignisphaera sp.]|uniref:tRNA pseudouridine(13) synthase TruD n=1 Tax=Ignisphaera aggregans TaxID=334771 RepID=A0A7J3JPN1_9CREN
MEGIGRLSRSLDFLSHSLLDIAIGMYVYTYPANRDSLDFVLNRPSDFIVSEIVNGLNTEELYGYLETVGGSNTEDGCYRDATYIVKKIGLSSIELCNTIKKVLGCRHCAVLGLKDANSVAYQLVLVRNCRTVDSNLHFRKGSRTVDAYLWLCNRISVIDIENSFKIRLNLLSQNSMNLVKEKIETMKKYGYTILNFFGYQRFGSRRPTTHIVGKKLICRDWEGFIEAVCGYPFPMESREAIIDRLHWYENRSSAAYPSSSIESRICSKNIDDLRTLKAIPKKMLQLYVNAYQSYLFNTILSRIWIEIIEKYGLDNGIEIIKRDLPYLPIPGSSTTVSRDIVKRILDEILDTEDIKLSDFCIEELNLCIHGDYRRSYLVIEDLSYSVSDSSIKITFTLESGSYATIVLREILNTDPILYT